MRIFEFVSPIWLFEMTHFDAVRVFKNLGVDPSSLDPTGLRQAYRQLAMKNHPDRGGKLETMQQINHAYEILSKKTEPSRPEPARSSTRYPREEGQTPPWAWAGYSGGYPPSSSIYRQDYRDVNFIKKTMWEKSGHSKVQWTIWGFDGTFFRDVTTVFGSPAIFRDMAEAMVTWQTKGGNPYECRAVLVNRQGDPHTMYVIYSDGQFHDNPQRLEHDSSNSNPSNDKDFLRELPHVLDMIRDGETL